MKRWIFALLICLLVIFAWWSNRQSALDDLEGANVASQANRVASQANRVSSQPDSSSSPERVSEETPPSDDEVVLDEDKQKLIWDAEHATFEIETYFGKSLREAISERDGEAINEFFVDDASATLISLSEGSESRAGTVVEFISDDSITEASDSAGLAKQLELSLSGIKTISRTKMRVLQLQHDEGDRWNARLLLQFEGLDDDGRPRMVESEHAVELQFANDEEIRDGRIISAWTDLSRKERKSDGPLMKEVTAEKGLQNVGLPDNWNIEIANRSQYWFQIGVCDFNRDGHLDIAVATINGEPLLLQNDGERFQDVTNEMMFRRWNYKSMQALATWFDIDNDGWPDLLLGNRLYRNQEGKLFQDITETSQLTIGHFPMGATVADYDSDGLLDLYLLYQHDAVMPERERMPWVGDAKSGTMNRLWRNEGGGRFRDVTEEANASGGLRHSFAATWHFLDEDHYPDLYIANDFGQNVHLRNRGDGSFEDVSKEMQTADFATSMGVTSGDLNNDGHPELYIANMYSKMGRRIIGNVGDADYPTGIFEQIQGSCAGNRLYTTSGRTDGTFHEVSENAGVNEVGWAYGPTLADFDSDGLLDIYATTGFMSFERRKPDG
ncbi:MAG: FG-GAP repeat domain-containing protein [Rubripirellula sp.]